MEYSEYIDRNEYVILYRLHGSGAIAEVPACVGGKPVRELADHVFAAEPSVRYGRSEVMRDPPVQASSPETGMIVSAACAEKGVDAFGAGAYSGSDAPEAGEPEPPALCGESIEIIRIPEGVEAIGNYAFYGCRRLREVHFPSTMRRIGSGMFNVCQNLSRLYFSLPEDAEEGETPGIMKEVLDAVSNEVEAVVLKDGKEQWRLLFPEYYEEGKENTPARIIEIVYHGTGHQYRNCFLNRKIQFDRYDAVFPLAQAQENAQTDIRLIRNRLRGGPGPSEECRSRYIEYLRSESDRLLGEILGSGERDPVSELELLDRSDFFTSTIIDSYIERASGQGRSEVVSFLMNVKRERFRPFRKDRYEL